MFNIRDALYHRLLINSIKQKCTSKFTHINQPLSLFNQMISMDPLPTAIDFNVLFTSISKMRPQRHDDVIIALSRELDLLGLKPNMHSLGILTNCYCHLGRVDFAFSLLGKRLKLGYVPDIVVYTTLINGLIDNNYVEQAFKLLDKIVNLGFQPNVITYGAVIKGLCKAGNNVDAIKLLRQIEVDGVCKPDVVIYTTIIQSLCRENLLSQALNLFQEMQTRGVAPNVVTYTAILQGCSNNHHLKD